jgi:hypothetical protein
LDYTFLKNLPEGNISPLAATIQNKKENKMSTILIILLVLLVLGALPVWPYSRSWGYGGSGLVGFLLLLVILGALFNWF